VATDRYRHAKIGVFALIFTALAAQIYFASRLLPANPRLDYVGAYESRLASVKRVLPKQGSVGYIETPRSPIVAYIGIDDSAIIHVNEHYLSQYALAPIVLLLNSTKPPLVLANLHDPTNRTELFNHMQLEVKEDFGNGIILLQSKR
jgi:hypothetical protein